MYRIYLEIGDGGYPIALCQFPYAHLDAFKEAVPYGDRIWRKDWRAWELTRYGLNCLLDAKAEEIDPLPLDVLDWIYTTPPIAPKKRKARRRPKPVTLDPPYERKPNTWAA